ncbi:MAG: hypothetical protein ACRDZ4_12630 [Egibacteraceae bacterium]
MADSRAVDGTVLRSLRIDRMWSQSETVAAIKAAAEALKETCGFNRQMLSRLENGAATTVSSDTLRYVVAAFAPLSEDDLRALLNGGTPPAELSRLAREGSTKGFPTNRAEFNKAALAGMGLAVFPPLAAAGPEQVGPELYRLYLTRGPVELMPYARLHAAQVGSHDALCFAGWLAYLMDNRGEARAYFTRARDTAPNDRQAAQVLTCLSYVHRGTPIGLARAEEADAKAVSADASTRLWAKKALARECASAPASAGMRAACYAAMRDAARLLDRPEPAGEGFFSPAARFHGWDEAYLAVERGQCHTLLGDGRSALAELRDATAAKTTVMLPTFLLVHRGSAWRLAREPEPACDALARALEPALATGYEQGVRRVLEARTRFPGNWSSLDCVRALDERLLRATT